MNTNVKSICVALLGEPYNPHSVLRLADAVDEENSSLANEIRCYVADGTMLPSEYKMSEDGRELYGVQYVVVRLLKMTSTVRYVCSCAMKVIPMLDQTSAEIATRAITCISENVECQQRFGDCKQLFSNLQDTADVNSTKWHRSYGNGACDTMTPEQLGLSNRPLIAMDLLLAATSASIYASNEGWLSIVDEVSSKLIECEQINNKANADRMTAEWERNTLLNIIAANE